MIEGKIEGKNMNWTGAAVITKEEMREAIEDSAQAYLKLFDDKGVPLGDEWTVEQEMQTVDGEAVYTFKWAKNEV